MWSAVKSPLIVSVTYFLILVALSKTMYSFVRFIPTFDIFYYTALT
jgi:hypothetical protein